MILKIVYLDGHERFIEDVDTFTLNSRLYVSVKESDRDTCESYDIDMTDCSYFEIEKKGEQEE